MKASFFHSGLQLHGSSRNCANRAHLVEPLHVYTDESRRGNGAVKMRPLTLSGRDEPIHSPETVLSIGESQTHVVCYEAVLVEVIHS